MIGKRFRSLPFIFANDNYTLSNLHWKIHMLKYTQLVSSQPKDTI